jgi:TonB family protein
MKKTAILLIFMVLAAFVPAKADVALDIKLNFFGPAADKSGEASVATSFYIQSMVQRHLQVSFAPKALLTELQKTFNAPGLTLLSSADLAWRSGGPASVMQIVQIDGRDYALALTPLPRPGAVNFKVGVVEENEMKKIKNALLDTEIILPDGEVAMLGFRDSQDRSYFIAFYVQGQGQDEKFAREAVRVAGKSKPKIIRMVRPVYPAEALKKRIEGAVILEAVIDKHGRVRDTRMISTPDSLLTAAAEQALKQWVYEPFVVNGETKDVLFTVTLTFRLDPEQGTKKVASSSLTRLEDSQKPKIIKQVNPVYPAEALKNMIQGVVVLEAIIDEVGKVSQLRVISSPSLLLNDAALSAVKQWEYEPFIENGKAKKVAFTVTVTFSLNKD